MATIVTVLDALVELEEALRDLYLWLSEIYSRDPFSSGVFYRLSLKEASHVNLVRCQRRIVLERTGHPVRVEVDMSEAHALIREIRTFRMQSEEPHLDDAVRFAMAIEIGAADRVHTAETADRDPDTQQLVRVLSADDRKHHEVLKKLAEKTTSNTEEP